MEGQMPEDIFNKIYNDAINNPKPIENIEEISLSLYNWMKANSKHTLFFINKGQTTIDPFNSFNWEEILDNNIIKQKNTDTYIQRDIYFYGIKKENGTIILIEFISIFKKVKEFRITIEDFENNIKPTLIQLYENNQKDINTLNNIFSYIGLHNLSITDKYMLKILNKYSFIQSKERVPYVQDYRSHTI